jgi:hypothetical protein
MLVDEDPEAALAHARYARRRASRIAVVREAAGITAYHAGEWAEALAELRAARRMGGGPGHLAVMADVERAMGRPERAIELSRSPEARELGRSEQIELAVVTAGARRDLGELDAAVVALQVPELEASRRDPWSARLFYAYADNLLAAGRESDALQWFVHAADADTDGETDADARVAELTGEPLADDGIEFALEDEHPGDDPTDQPASDATDNTAEKPEDVDITAGDATDAVTADAAATSADSATDDADNPVGEAVDAPTHTSDELAGPMVDDGTRTATANAGDDSADAVPVQAQGDAADRLDDSAPVGRPDATADPEAPAPEREVGIPSRPAAEPVGSDLGVDAAPSSFADDERAAGDDGAIAVPAPDTTDPAEHDPAAHTARSTSVSVADATYRAVSGPVDDAADNATVDDGAVDQAPGKAEDQPRSAPATNGDADAADPDSASTNGSDHHPDPAVVAARGESDPR